MALKVDNGHNAAVGLRVGVGELVARARSGDRTALGELYTEFADRIYGFCFTLLRDREQAADATQDTFVLAFQRIDQLRDPERLTSWMFAIARHVCLGQLGQRDRVKPVEAVPDVALLEDDPVEAVLASEAAALVWAAASGLSKRDRAVLFLNTRQGLEGAELTAALGLNHANLIPL
jgi:RNA polymerase sigma factor (sigma-70 family)